MSHDLVDPILCEHCAADNELKYEIQERGRSVPLCPICHREGGKAISATDPRIKQIFRALIRLNFSEWDYNTHLGGEGLGKLVVESQAIFSLEKNFSPEAFEEAFLEMENKEWYPKAEEEIALGGGYWDGGVLYGLRDRRDSKVERVVFAALEENWFETEAAARELIDRLREDLTVIVPSGREFFRGRIGVKSRLSRKDEYFADRRKFWYHPFSGKDIGRPPVKSATEGRFNRQRVSLLYLASDVQTAVAELRPHPGHLVSTAKFRLQRDLKVANFSTHDIRNFLSDPRLEDLRSILSIADVLNVPVQPEHRVLYSATQLFADVLRSAGFEGLTFNSSVSKGCNLTSFVGDAFELVAGSEGVQDVVSLRYMVEPAQTLAADYDQSKWKEDVDSPLGTLLHGMARLGR